MDYNHLKTLNINKLLFLRVFLNRRRPKNKTIVKKTYHNFLKYLTVIYL